MDEHQDQEHPVDVMLRKIGVDPRSVDPALKSVRPNFTYTEMANAMQFKDKTLGMYQLSSANQVRCFQPSDSVFTLLKLAERSGHSLARSVGRVREAGIQKPSKTRSPSLEITNIQPYTSPNLRDLWALTTRVRCHRRSPDSMMVHIAGSMGVPCVGLWGPMSPESRVAYYKNHLPIFHRELCPHAPCFAYSNTFPKYCPPRPNGRTTCEVLAGISPIEIIEAISKVVTCHDEVVATAATGSTCLDAPEKHRLRDQPLRKRHAA
jgi:hypothetical protein